MKITFDPPHPDGPLVRQEPLSVPAGSTQGVPLSVTLEAGAHVCVTPVASDTLTRRELRGETVCFDVSQPLSPPRTACEDLIALAASPQTKASCLANAELIALLADCPGALGGAGAAGSAGASAAPDAEDGCSLQAIARSDRSAALAPLFAAIAGVWIARRRRG